MSDYISNLKAWELNKGRKKAAKIIAILFVLSAVFTLYLAFSIFRTPAPVPEDLRISPLNITVTPDDSQRALTACWILKKAEYKITAPDYIPDDTAGDPPGAGLQFCFTYLDNEYRAQNENYSIIAKPLKTGAFSVEHCLPKPDCKVSALFLFEDRFEIALTDIAGIRVND